MVERSTAEPGPSTRTDTAPTSVVPLGASAWPSAAWCAAEALMRPWYQSTFGQAAPAHSTRKSLAKAASAPPAVASPRAMGHSASRAGGCGHGGAAAVRHVVIPGLAACHPLAEGGEGQHMPSEARCSAKAQVALAAQSSQQRSRVTFRHSKYRTGLRGSEVEVRSGGQKSAVGSEGGR